MKRSAKILAAVVILGYFYWAVGRAADAQAHLVRTADKPALNHLQNREASQEMNLAHARYVARHGARANQRWHRLAVRWITVELLETRRALLVRERPTGVDAAWAWYQTRDTQCVVNHEGGWTSPSISPPGMYAGRFQMDYSFERETAFGRKMSDRHGRAWNWPPWAQVFHAYEVWSYSSWSRWPTYARYCA